MTMIASNLQQVQARMARACQAYGRSVKDVALLAVSKTFDAQTVRAAWEAGQYAFGENYIQEAIEKMQALADVPIEWHCIGPIQSNKSRLVAEHFDWVHTVDRLRIAERLSNQRPVGRGELQVCIQVNIDGGANKSGVTVGELPALAEAVARLPGLCLRGLMAIPEPSPDFDAARAVHERMKATFDDLRQGGLMLDTLSLGMSADLEPAIAAGSTMVRVGSAIFGARTAQPAGA